MFIFFAIVALLILAALLLLCFLAFKLWDEFRMIRTGDAPFSLIQPKPDKPLRQRR